jgi:hypothetical protein
MMAGANTTIASYNVIAVRIYNFCLKNRSQMWRCGNDGPEKDADAEIQEAVDGVKDQLEEKLGRSVAELTAKRGCVQVIQVIFLSFSFLFCSIRQELQLLSSYFEFFTPEQGAGHEFSEKGSKCSPTHFLSRL